jgi:hypothetical protein
VVPVGARTRWYGFSGLNQEGFPPRSQTTHVIDFRVNSGLIRSGRSTAQDGSAHIRPRHSCATTCPPALNRSGNVVLAGSGEANGNDNRRDHSHRASRKVSIRRSVSFEGKFKWVIPVLCVSIVVCGRLCRPQCWRPVSPRPLRRLLRTLPLPRRSRPRRGWYTGSTRVCRPVPASRPLF